MKRTLLFVQDLLRYFDILFLIRFVLILLALQFSNYCYRGLTDATGILHVPFLENYLNYIAAIKWFLLHTTQYLVGLLNIDVAAVGLRKLTIPGRPSLILGMPCVGLGMILFWIAFVTAHNMRWTQKVTWTILGILGINCINCLRICLMVVAVQEQWQFNKYMNHHDLFRLCAYGAILLMMRFFYRYLKKQEGFRQDKVPVEIPALSHF